jgi:hypothetical protein
VAAAAVSNDRSRPHQPRRDNASRIPEEQMIVLGVILLIIGWLTGISILYTVGGILLVVGLVLLLLGSVGRGVGGRRWYF